MIAARRWAPALVAAVSAVVAAAWYAFLLWTRDVGLTTFGYDQAYFQQLVWNLDHGRGLVSSWGSGPFLGLHFEPLLILPAAIELAWPDPRVLSLLAAGSLAAIVVAAYLFLAALTGRRWLAAALAAPLPLWPAVQEAMRANFHPETLGIAAALLAGWAIVQGHRATAVILAGLALMAKEDQGWNLLVIGLAVATLPELKRAGLALAAAGVAWGAAVEGVVMPLIRSGRHVDTDNYYSWLWTASPGAVGHALAAPAGWTAALVMIACASGLALLRPAWLALAAPPLAADLLSSHGPQPLLHLQYALPLLVPLLVAAALAAASVNPKWLVALLPVPPLVLGLVLGSVPPAGGNPDPGAFSRPPALAQLDACLRVLPAGAPVAADDPLTVRLASRPSIRELTLARASDYVVIDHQALLPGYVDREARALVMSGPGRPVLCDGRFAVLGPLPGS